MKRALTLLLFGLCIGYCSYAAAAALPIYIVSALPLGGSRDIVQTFVITQDACEYVEVNFAPAVPTKDHYRCHVLSGSEALLAGQDAKVSISLDTPAGVEVHRFGFIQQEVLYYYDPPGETRFVRASLLRVMPSQLPVIQQLSPGANPSPIMDPAGAALPPPTADSLLHIKLQGTDCSVQYGRRPSALCALTGWDPQHITVAVSGAYLQQPEDKVLISLRPVGGSGGWSYTPVQFPAYSPLLLAVLHGDLAAVQALLAQGAAPNSHAPGLDPPLAMAVRRRTLDIADLLVDHDADVNVEDPAFGNVLEMAAGHGEDKDRAAWFEFVKKLLARGADVNRAGRFGLTPLMAAIGVPDPDMVQLLLDSGADINATATVPFGALLGMKNGPMDAYDLAQARIDFYNKLRARGDSSDHPDALPNLQKILGILAQHGAKPRPR